MAVTLQSASDHYAETTRLTAAVLAGARRLWSQLGSVDGPWEVLSPHLTALLTAGQVAMGREAVRYVADVLDEQQIDAPQVASPRPEAVAGVASSGVGLAVLMSYPLTAARSALANGASLQDGLQQGRRSLDGIVKMQMQDAGRAMESVSSTVRPAIVGYVRHLSLPSCPKCAVLAGKFYHWNEGFLRHPKCDCFHTPVDSVASGENLALDPLGAIKSGQIHGLTKAEQAAIDDGADLGQVINVKGKAMRVEQVDGRKIRTTTVGTSKRGLAGQRLRGAVRLRPQSIYQIADGNRSEAVRLLRLHGYIL